MFLLLKTTYEQIFVHFILSVFMFMFEHIPEKTNF